MTNAMGAKYFDTFTEVGRKGAQSIVDAINEQGGNARIGECWRDFGANWGWETILTTAVGDYASGLGVQLLYPIDFDRLNDDTLDSARREEIIAKGVGYSRPKDYSAAPKEPMTAEGLLSAMIAHYVDTDMKSAFGPDAEKRAKRNGMGDMLIHAAMVAKGMTEEAATEYVGEEIADRIANRA